MDYFSVGESCDFGVDDFVYFGNSKKHTEEFNLSELMKIREKKNKRITDNYQKILDNCLSRINEANKYYKTELMFEVPTVLFGTSEYNIVDCITYIVTHLKKIGFDTLILNQNLYISWNYFMEKNNLK